MLRRYLYYVYCLVALIWFGLSAVHAQDETALRIGSKRFTESYILAELLAQTAASSGAKTQVLQGLGNTAIVFEALKSGQIDAYAEYSGTIATEILKPRQIWLFSPCRWSWRSLV